jgi:dienelactone hydrolase
LQLTSQSTAALKKLLPMTVRLAGVLLLLLSCWQVIAKEVVVQITPQVEGKLVVPEGKVDRAVLMIHGWNSQMDEVGNLYADLAAALADKGVASLRFNVTGEGERTGYIVTSTYDSRLAESEAAFTFLRNELPDASYGIQGWSLGGLTTMALATKHPEWFVAMVLWSGADTMRGDGDEKYNKAARTAMREGKGAFDDWTRITLTREFLASYIAVDASQLLARYPGSFLSIRGDQDYLVANERMWMKKLPTDDKTAIVIGGADHTFNVLEDPRPAFAQRVVDETVRFFDRTLSREN